MSYVIVNNYPGGNREQYDNTVAVVHPDGGARLPDGQTGHYAGPTEDGFAVIAVWEDKAAWERFRDNDLMPALQQVEDGLPGPPQGVEFELEVSLPE